VGGTREADRSGRAPSNGAPLRRRQLELCESAVQTLEAIANGTISDQSTVRDVARGEALRLRQAMAVVERENPVYQALSLLAVEFAERGLLVEYSTDGITEVSGQVAQAVLDSTRQALGNVLDHAGSSQAVVRAVATPGWIQVTVRDHGSGFDPTGSGAGVGPGPSVTAPLVDIGGTASVWSEPGRGTRVSISIPT
jgi:signal transduction histidine kinase